MIRFDGKHVFMILACLQMSVSAAVLYTTDGATYSQDFTSLSASTGVAQTWTDDTTLSGWYASSTGGGIPSTYTP